MQTLEWIIDGGVNNHVTRGKVNFVNLDNQCSTHIYMANDLKICSQCAGDVKLDMTVNGCNESVSVKDAMYVPNLSNIFLKCK